MSSENLVTLVLSGLPLMFAIHIKTPHSFQSLKDSTSECHSTLCLYSGTLAGMSSLAPILHNHINVDVATILPGSLRLNHLKKFSSFAWRLVKHRNVGGCTDANYWMGTSGGILHSAMPARQSPHYCLSIIRDVLSYAPKDISVTPWKVPDNYDPVKSLMVRALSTDDNSIFDFGLAPVLSTLQGPFHVITRSPFSSTKWCKRPISLKEFALMLDLPTQEISRLVTLNNSESAFRTGNHDLFSVVPLTSFVMCYGAQVFMTLMAKLQLCMIISKGGILFCQGFCYKIHQVLHVRLT